MSIVTKRIGVAMLAFAMVATLAAPLSAVNAQSTSASCAATFMRNLGVGSTGSDVLALQRFLNQSADTRVAASGAGSPGLETSYYGSLTAAAVSRFQAKYRAEVLTPLGLVNPTGYFGAASRAKLVALCAGNPTTPPTTPPGQGGDDDDDDGDLEGGAGEIGDADFIRSLSDEEVGEDEEDAEVAGLEIEADGSDIELTAVTITFDEGAGSTDDFEDYAEEVSIWFDGEEMARVSADSFEDDEDWSETISLDDGAIIREGETGELIVAVSGQGNLDNDQEGDEWDIAFTSVRFVDADGATITDDSTGDIDDTVPAGTTSRTFSFESFTTAADVELSISSGDDEVNDSQTITIEEDNETTDVEILSFMMEAEGDSDLMIETLGINIDVTGESHVDDVIAGGTNPAIRLMIDGEEYGEANYADDADDTDVGTTEDVVFDDVEYELAAGEEVEVVVVVDLLSTDDGLAQGSTIAAEVGETETDQTDLWDVEDESGESLGDTELTGSASSDAHSVFENGIMVEVVSTSSDANDNQTEGTFEIEVEITAFGEDAYIHELAHTSSSTDAGFYYTIYKNGVATSTTMTVGDLVSTSADDDGEYFVVEAGENNSETFTLTVTIDPGTGGGGLYTVELDSVRFDPDAAADSASTDDLWYTIPSAEDAETPAESLVASA